MTRVAFYAPMKPPTHPNPSGDRKMARNLITAISAGPATVDLVSELRVHDAVGNPTEQARLRDLAQAEATALIPKLSANNTSIWVTYHNYYKAPDMIGPTVARALNIPYIQIESSRAKSRLTGPWADYAAAAEAATDAADLICYPIQLDANTLIRDQTAHQKLSLLRPFLPTRSLPSNTYQPEGPILAAGMMRKRDKLESYTVIADTLAALRTPNWQLNIAGDGPARPEVEALMKPFGERVRFLGQLDRDGMDAAYAEASIFLWPGVNEAYGMVYLEAQAAGVPVVAQDRDGVRDVVLPGEYPAPKDGPIALAQYVDQLLTNPGARSLRSVAGRAMIEQNHLIDAATRSFWSAVRPIMDMTS
jgi:Glycosyl transferases group 1